MTKRKDPACSQRPPTIQWTPEMEAILRDGLDTGRSLADMARQMDVWPAKVRTAIQRMRAAAALPTPDLAAQYRMLDAQRKKAAQAEERRAAWAAGALRDDSLEWRAWNLIHTRKLPARDAARRLGVPVHEVFDALARQKVALLEKTMAAVKKAEGKETRHAA